MLLRKSQLEEDLIRNEAYAKRMIEEAKKSSHPELYIPLLEEIQKEVDYIISELKKYE